MDGEEPQVGKRWPDEAGNASCRRVIVAFSAAGRLGLIPVRVIFVRIDMDALIRITKIATRSMLKQL